MTKEQRNIIIEMRLDGVGYKSISHLLGLTRDAVRNYCVKIGLDGIASENYEEEFRLSFNKELVGKNCRYCGQVLTQNKTGRTKYYCSSICRIAWSKDHHKVYNYTCYYCCVNYQSNASKSKYCSHKCYIKNRFWKEEDRASVMLQLSKGNSIDNVPGWISDLINKK